MADNAYVEDVMGYEVFVDECLDSPSYDTGSHLANLPNLLLDSKSNELSTKSDILEFMLDDINSCPYLVTDFDSSSNSNSCPDLQSVSDSSDGSLDFVIAKALPNDISLDAYMYTFNAAMLANSSALPMVQTELYDSEASRHMSPYHYKFIDFIDIELKTITLA